MRIPSLAETTFGHSGLGALRGSAVQKALLETSVAVHRPKLVSSPAKSTGREQVSGWGLEAKHSLRKRARRLEDVAFNPKRELACGKRMHA